MITTTQNTEFEVPIEKTLCKQCDVCKDYIYERKTKTGKIISFLYCEQGKDIVSLANWRLTSDGYVGSTTGINSHYRLFHTFFKQNQLNVIDHIFGEKFDNRLCMMREIKPSCNSQNRTHKRSSIFPGVHYHKRVGRFESRIMINGKRECLGYYTDEIEAFHNYVLKAEAEGISINKFTEAYQKYQHWLNMEDILKSMREDPENYNEDRWD